MADAKTEKLQGGKLRCGGSYLFLNCFFLCVVECKHDYFTDKSHLLSCSLSVKTELEQGGNKPGFYAVLGVLVDMSVFNSGGSDSLAAAVPPGFWG